MYSYGPPHMAVQKQDDQLEYTYSSYVRIRDVDLKICLRWWMIGRSSEGGSTISVLAVRHDDDDIVYISEFISCRIIEESKISSNGIYLRTLCSTIFLLKLIFKTFSCPSNIPSNLFSFPIIFPMLSWLSRYIAYGLSLICSS